MKKTYQPLTLTEAEEYLYSATKNADIVDTMEEGNKLILAELLKLHERIDEIENQANEMMSPDKMAEMAGNLFGGKF